MSHPPSSPSWRVADSRVLAIILGIAVSTAGASVASAQPRTVAVEVRASSSSGAWTPASSAPVIDEDLGPTHHEPRMPLVIAGAVTWGVGYLLAVIWGGYYIDQLRLGPVGCNDTYAGWHFLPVAGPLVGMFAGGACVPDQLHIEEAVMPVASTAVQLAGVIMLAIGLAGHRVHDVPAVTLHWNETGGGVSVGGTF